MLDYHRISLLSSCSLMCNCVQRPLNAVDCHPYFVCVVDTYPSETHCL
jgi:hypothetical protein